MLSIHFSQSRRQHVPDELRPTFDAFLAGVRADLGAYTTPHCVHPAENHQAPALPGLVKLPELCPGRAEYVPKRCAIPITRAKSSALNSRLPYRKKRGGSRLGIEPAAPSADPLSPHPYQRPPRLPSPFCREIYLLPPRPRSLPSLPHSCFSAGPSRLKSGPVAPAVLSGAPSRRPRPRSPRRRATVPASCPPIRLGPRLLGPRSGITAPHPRLPGGLFFPQGHTQTS